MFALAVLGREEEVVLGREKGDELVLVSARLGDPFPCFEIAVDGRDKGDEVRAVVLARDSALTCRSALTGRTELVGPRLAFTIGLRLTKGETDAVGLRPRKGDTLASKPSSSPSSSITSTSSDAVRWKPPKV